MGSNNEEDHKDPEYVPSDSLMDSEDENERDDINPKGDSDMDHGETKNTSPPHWYPTRQRGFKRSLLELLNEPDYYVSPHVYPRSPHKKNPRNNQ